MTTLELNVSNTSTPETPLCIEEIEVHFRTTAESIFTATLIIFITLTTIVGNTMVMAASLVDNNLRSQVGNCLIANLAFADLLCGYFVMIPSIVSILKDRWPLGKTACEMHLAFNYGLLSISNVTLAMISYDRALAVTKPLSYHQLMTPTRMRCMVGFTWIHGMTLATIPTAKGWSVYDYWEALCTVCWVDVHHQSNIFAGICTVFCYGIPTTAMVYFNSKIVFSTVHLQTVALRPRNRMSSDSQLTSENLPKECWFRLFCNENTKKTLRSLYVLIAVYLVCYTPYAIMKLSKSIGGGHVLPDWMSMFASIMQFLSSATNPFIYALLRKDFRTAFEKLLRMMLRKLNYKNRI